VEMTLCWLSGLEQVEIKTANKKIPNLFFKV